MKRSAGKALVDDDLADEIALYCRLVEAVGRQPLTQADIDFLLGIRARPDRPVAPS